MSRIYDALQRAEVERSGIAQHGNGLELIEAFTSALCEPLPQIVKADLGGVRSCEWSSSSAALPSLAENGLTVEQFRGLRSHLYLERLQHELKSITVSSGMPGEGKTFVATNLALSLAQNKDARVLLVDADLRRPSVHRLLGAPSSPGLADYLLGKVALTDTIQKPDAPQDTKSLWHKAINLHFIPAGNCSGNAQELLDSRRIYELINAVSPHFEWILVDTPPVLAVTDAVDISQGTDAVLLIARSAVTPFKVAQKAHAAFNKSRVLGFVLNAVKEDLKHGPYYDYYYASTGVDDSKARKGGRE